MKGPQVIGIDTKSRAFHWYTVGERVTGHDSFTSSQDDHDVARAEVYAAAKEMFTEIRPAHIFCEAPLALQNGKTTRLLCMAAAAVFCGFIASDVDAVWYWVDPASWKRQVLGGAPPRGEKHKPWIRRRCLEVWPDEMQGWLLERFDREPDYFDAWCLYQYGRQVVDS